MNYIPSFLPCVCACVHACVHACVCVKLCTCMFMCMFFVHGSHPVFEYVFLLYNSFIDAHFFFFYILLKNKKEKNVIIGSVLSSINLELRVTATKMCDFRHPELDKNHTFEKSIFDFIFVFSFSLPSERSIFFLLALFVLFISFPFEKQKNWNFSWIKLLACGKCVINF